MYPGDFTPSDSVVTVAYTAVTSLNGNPRKARIRKSQANGCWIVSAPIPGGYAVWARGFPDWETAVMHLYTFRHADDVIDETQYHTLKTALNQSRYHAETPSPSACAPRGT